ncbi:MAG: hypothetical protein QNJ46_13020 [Leptolyngbyaceae cyanobacterium MO_188.B28]|nr:hypothetical protein [Leptolyngbyaceae cyanobacterium MO_188.B28]
MEWTAQARFYVMQHQELLLTTAEVSATFAGFSGVIGVFSEHTRNLEAQLQRHRLLQMIVTSLSALTMSVSPFLIAAFRFPEPLVWRISSAIYVFPATLLTALAIYSSRPFIRAGLASDLTSHVIAVITTITVGVSILNGLGVFPSQASAIYLVTLFFTLGLSGFFFTQLVAAFQPPQD